MRQLGRALLGSKQTQRLALKTASAKGLNLIGPECSKCMPQGFTENSSGICQQLLETNSWVSYQKDRLTERSEKERWLYAQALPSDGTFRDCALWRIMDFTEIVQPGDFENKQIQQVLRGRGRGKSALELLQYLKCQIFKKIIPSYAKKQESVTHAHEKGQATDTAYERGQILNLACKNKNQVLKIYLKN